jgi:hypothetical protein
MTADELRRDPKYSGLIIGVVGMIVIFGAVVWAKSTEIARRREAAVVAFVDSVALANEERAISGALRNHDEAVNDAQAVYFAACAKYRCDSPEALSAAASYHAAKRDNSWTNAGQQYRQIIECHRKGKERAWCLVPATE